MPRPRSNPITTGIQEIRRSLSSIGRALNRLAPSLSEFDAAGAKNSTPPERKLRLSRERRAVLKLQGRYMGHVRGLKTNQKAQVKALRAAKGFRAAIALARKLAAG